MVKEISRTLDVKQKCEIVVFEDSFGAQHVIQHRLLGTYDHDAIEKQLVAEMEARDEQFRKVAEARGHKV